MLSNSTNLLTPAAEYTISSHERTNYVGVYKFLVLVTFLLMTKLTISQWDLNYFEQGVVANIVKFILQEVE